MKRLIAVFFTLRINWIGMFIRKYRLPYILLAFLMGVILAHQWPSSDYRNSYLYNDNLKASAAYEQFCLNNSGSIPHNLDFLPRSIRNQVNKEGYPIRLELDSFSDSGVKYDLIYDLDKIYPINGESILSNIIGVFCGNQLMINNWIIGEIGTPSTDSSKNAK